MLFLKWSFVVGFTVFNFLGTAQASDPWETVVKNEFSNEIKNIKNALTEAQKQRIKEFIRADEEGENFDSSLFTQSQTYAKTISDTFIVKKWSKNINLTNCKNANFEFWPLPLKRDQGEDEGDLKINWQLGTELGALGRFGIIGAYCEENPDLWMSAWIYFKDLNDRKLITFP